MPNDDMGHPDNITNETFDKLAQKLGISTDEVKKQMDEYIKSNATDNAAFEEVFAKASQAWGQSVDNAKAETLKLLEKGK